MSSGRLRNDVVARDRHDLESMMKRARWAMERRPSNTEYNVYHRTISKFGHDVTVYDVYMVDCTRHARDTRAGRPVYLGTFPFREEADRYVADHKKGKATFCFRGFRTSFAKRSIEP